MKSFSQLLPILALCVAAFTRLVCSAAMNFGVQFNQAEYKPTMAASYYSNARAANVSVLTEKYIEEYCTEFVKRLDDNAIEYIRAMIIDNNEVNFGTLFQVVRHTNGEIKNLIAVDLSRFRQNHAPTFISFNLDEVQQAAVNAVPQADYVSKHKSSSSSSSSRSRRHHSRSIVKVERACRRAMTKIIRSKHAKVWFMPRFGTVKYGESAVKRQGRWTGAGIQRGFVLVNKKLYFNLKKRFSKHQMTHLRVYFPKMQARQKLYGIQGYHGSGPNDVIMHKKDFKHLGFEVAEGVYKNVLWVLIPYKSTDIRRHPCNIFCPASKSYSLVTYRHRKHHGKHHKKSSSSSSTHKHHKRRRHHRRHHKSSSSVSRQLKFRIHGSSHRHYGKRNHGRSHYGKRPHARRFHA